MSENPTFVPLCPPPFLLSWLVLLEGLLKVTIQDWRVAELQEALDVQVEKLGS